MTIIDTCTRLVELAVMNDGTSAEVARIVNQVWFNRYLRPARCIHDQGPEFTQELLDSDGVQHAGTTAKSPQANSIVERVHRTPNDKMRMERIAIRGELRTVFRQ